MSEIDDLRRENDVLRGLLARSNADCPYCALPAEEMSRCPSGFPGCSRADDMVPDNPATASLTRETLGPILRRLAAGLDGLERRSAVEDATQHILELQRGGDPPAPIDISHIIAQLRHAYGHLRDGSVVSQEEFARGLLAPQIRALEQLRRRSVPRIDYHNPGRKGVSIYLRMSEYDDEAHLVLEPLPGLVVTLDVDGTLLSLDIEDLETNMAPDPLSTAPVGLDLSAGSASDGQ